MTCKLIRLILGGAGMLTILAAAARFDLKVRNDFFAGFAGNAEALQRGMKGTEEALAADPKNAEALVWHGAGLFFSAGQAFQKQDTQQGMELWTRGLKEMDDAVAMEPDSVGVRIPRGAAVLTSAHFVPSSDLSQPLLNRGVEDYQHTLDLQSAYFDKLGPHPRGELLIGLADGYAMLGQKEKARALFQRAQSELKGTVYEKKAAQWLETGSLPTARVMCSGCHTGPTSVPSQN